MGKKLHTGGSVIEPARKKALESGEKRYFSRKPCPKGHEPWRWTSSHSCCTCTGLSAARWQRTHRDKVAAKAGRYYKRWSWQLRGINLRKKYGMTVSDYDAMYDRQGGKCAVCKKTGTRGGLTGLCVDHDHVTGLVRELLCHLCNTAIGKLGDDPALLYAAAAYLERHARGSIESSSAA